MPLPVRQSPAHRETVSDLLEQRTTALMALARIASKQDLNPWSIAAEAFNRINLQ
jgi:hypothetical protein